MRQGSVSELYGFYKVESGCLWGKRGQEVLRGEVLYVGSQGSQVRDQICHGQTVLFKII